jgi:hypothetical protein
MERNTILELIINYTLNQNAYRANMPVDGDIWTMTLLLNRRYMRLRGLYTFEMSPRERINNGTAYKLIGSHGAEFIPPSSLASVNKLARSLFEMQQGSSIVSVIPDSNFSFDLCGHFSIHFKHSIGCGYADGAGERRCQCVKRIGYTWDDFSSERDRMQHLLHKTICRMFDQRVAHNGHMTLIHLEASNEPVNHAGRLFSHMSRGMADTGACTNSTIGCRHECEWKEDADNVYPYYRIDDASYPFNASSLGGIQTCKYTAVPLRNVAKANYYSTTGDEAIELFFHKNGRFITSFRPNTTTVHVPFIRINSSHFYPTVNISLLHGVFQADASWLAGEISYNGTVARQIFSHFEHSHLGPIPFVAKQRRLRIPIPADVAGLIPVEAFTRMFPPKGEAADERMHRWDNFNAMAESNRSASGDL